MRSAPLIRTFNLNQTVSLAKFLLKNQIPKTLPVVKLNYEYSVRGCLSVLPYDEIWVIINDIVNKSPWFPGGKKVTSYEDDLFQDIVEMMDQFYLDTFDSPPKIDDLVWDKEGIDFSYRYKEASSVKLKLERLTMTKKLHKVANDILGFRFVLKTDTDKLKSIVEEFVSFCPFGDAVCTIIDQTDGKRNDDGYKGIHVNIRPNNLVIPIEIQFWTRTHALLNEYLHANIYKIDDESLNQYALDLRTWLESVPFLPESDGVAVQSYVDFIYDKAFSDEDDVDDLYDDEVDDFLDALIDEEVKDDEEK
jgi:hypothetical protein